MADIRINSLPTTASSSSSDDFLALDGATNGTRKLNAYSPSFGGNATVGGTLTVSGTGDSSFATDASHFLALDSGVFRIRSNGYLSAEPSAGTILSSNAYYGLNWAGSGNGTFLYLGMSGGANQSKIYLGSTYLGSPTVKFTFDTSSGNLLLGTTTDGGQKLQVAGTGYVSGTLETGGNLTVGSGSGTIRLAAANGSKGQYTTDGTNTYLDYIGSIAIRSLPTYNPALTLDSSQNATFAGTVTVSGNTTLNTGSGDGELFFNNNQRLIQTVVGNLYISRGWEYTGGDKARSAEAAFMGLQNDGVHFWVNTGLTAGNAYTPTRRMWIKTNGTINLPSLPTSASGLSAGDIWNDSGTLKIV